MCYGDNGSRSVNPHGFSQDINGILLDIQDDPFGGVSKIIIREIKERYGFDDIPFQDGDAVLDIGAHVGVVSIYLAKRHPGITVYAFEPVPDNYRHLLRNIQANGVENVVPVPQAVTADGRELGLVYVSGVNSGGASICARRGRHIAVASTTLQNIFSVYGIRQCRLLKIDCEGCEYEIFERADPEILSRIEYVRGEVHVNQVLGKSEALIARLSQFVEPEKIQLSTSRI